MMRKRTLLTVIPLLLLVGAGYGFWRFRTGAKESPYVTVPAQREDVTQVVSSTGTLQAVITVQVGSQVSGTIDKLFVDFNSKVKKDQLVAVIDPEIFQAKVDQARANLDGSRASVVNAAVTSLGGPDALATRMYFDKSPTTAPTYPGAGACF